MPVAEVWFGEDFPGNDALEQAEYEKKIRELEQKLSEADGRAKILLDEQHAAFKDEISKAQRAAATAHEDVLAMQRRLKRDKESASKQVVKYHDELKKLRADYDDTITELCDRDDEAEEYRKIIRKIEAISTDTLTRFLAQAQGNERRWIVAMAALRLIFQQISMGFISSGTDLRVSNVLQAVKRWVECPPLPMWDDPADPPAFEEEEEFLRHYFQVGSRTMEFKIPEETKRKSDE